MRLKEWQKILLIIIVSFAVAGIFYSALFSGLEGVPSKISEHSILELTIGGEIPERSTEEPMLAALERKTQLSVQSLLQTLRKAKKDDRIKALLLRAFPVAMGWGKVDELRNALLDFQSGGKPIYAHLEVAGNKAYYLASVADTIAGLAPGILVVNGLDSEPIFLKETLAKIGIEADFVAHGKYKNAPEIFTRKNLSPAYREVLNSLLDEFYGRLVEGIAEGRHLQKEQVIAFIDQGFSTVEQGYQDGLIDTLMFYNDFKEYVKVLSGDSAQAEFVSFNQYQNISPKGLNISDENLLAVIYGVGTIVTGSERQFGQDGLITSDGMANSIRKAAENKKVKAIILRIDSPGGSGAASDVIWREVKRAREKKPVIVSVSDLAASGGYYISMAADSIIAHPNSIVGSIGVFAGKFSWNKFYKKIGLGHEKILRGKNADIFSPSQKFTAEQRKLLRRFIMDFYQLFIGKVAEGRHMNVEAVDRVAQGRVWTGRQALELGLVDKLGDFDDAVQTAKRMANIPEEQRVQLLIYPRIQSIFERILDQSVTAQMEMIFPEVRDLPASLRSVINALPYFQPGEALYLTPLIIDRGLLP